MMSQQISATRNLHVDAFKGFAILLVVLGHAIQVNVPDFDNNLLFRVIYSFHMPLFMFLSGYLAWGRNIDLKRRFVQLVIPFISWYLLGYLFNRSIGFTDYIIRWVKSPDWGLWFLWVLFLNFGIFYFVQHIPRIISKHALVNDTTISKANLFEFAFFVLVWFIIYRIPINILGVGLVKWHLIFFGSGYFIAKYKGHLVRFTNFAKYACYIIFPILAITWHRLGGPSFQQSLVNFFINYHLKGSSLILHHACLK
jgi:fucose 4-O-acetylase-like acetyltransferase